MLIETDTYARALERAHNGTLTHTHMELLEM